MRKHMAFRLSLISASIASWHGAAVAQSTSAEVLALTRPDSQVTVGIGDQTGDRRQLGKYDGMRESGYYFLLDADIRLRDDNAGTNTEFTVRNLGLDTLEGRMRVEQQGNWGGTIDYDRLVSRNPNSFITGVTGIGTINLGYGSAIGSSTTAGTAGGTAATNQANGFRYPAANHVELGTTRDTLSFSAYKYIDNELLAEISVREVEKNGTRHWGRGSNAEFAVEPIDYRTTEVEAKLNLTQEKLQVSAGVGISRFDNANSFVNTFAGSATNVLPANGNGYSRTNGYTVLSLPLDNEAHRLFANVGYSFTPSTRGTAKASYTVATQSDSLQPITDALVATGAHMTNTVMNPGATPASLDGKIVTSLLELGLTTKPMEKLSVVGNVRYQNREDKTPHRAYASYWTFRCSLSGTTTFASPTLPVAGQPCSNFLPAGTGALFGNVTIAAVPITAVEVENNPHDFRNLGGKLEATYRLPKGYSLTGGINLDRRERSYETNASGEYDGVVKMRGRTDEWTWNLQARGAVTESIGGSLALQYADRSGSALQPAGGAAKASQPFNFVNPAPYADRTREKVRAAFDWAATDNIQFSLVGELARDKYEAGKGGVKDGSTRLLAVDATVALNDDWQLTGWVSQDVTKHDQTNYTFDGRQTSNPNWACSSVPGMTDSTGAAITCFVDLIWDAALQDTGTAIGLGIRGKAMPKLSVGADAQWSHNQSRYEIRSNITDITTATSGNAKQVLPDINSYTVRIALFGQYAVHKKADLRLDVVHTHWKTNDWTTLMYNTAGNALMPFTYMDGTQVVAAQRQNSNYAGLKYIYRFQ